MNFIAIIILITIAADFLVNLLADYLNLKVLKQEVPEEFTELYDEQEYRRSQEYLQVNTRFGWLASIIDLVFILAFWFGKGFFFLDQWVRSIDQGPIISGLIYMGILILLKALLSLPFRIYVIFVIEERFGFNQTTWSTFVCDLGKGWFSPFYWEHRC